MASLAECVETYLGVKPCMFEIERLNIIQVILTCFCVEESGSQLNKNLFNPDILQFSNKNSAFTLNLD